MNDRCTLSNMDSLLFQSAVGARELYQKKNEINHQIKVCRANIAERRSYIKIVCNNIKKLEDEIKVKQSTVMHHKANAKSMKTTISLLLECKQTLKAELESKKARYNQDTEVYAERIASCRRTLQSHKEYYFQNPFAQSLLTLQANIEKTECQIKACDDQIRAKQKELDQLTGPEVSSFSTEELPDSVFVQQPKTGQQKQLDYQAEEDSDPSVDISSLHLSQTEIGQKTSVEEPAEEILEENQVQDISEKTSEELRSLQQTDEPSQPEEMLIMEEQEQETSQQDQEQLTTAAAVEEDLQEGAAVDEEEIPSAEEGDQEDVCHQTSCQDTNPQSFSVETTPAFPFHFSPTSSPCPGSAGTKSPGFPFSLHSNPSTPGFSGFGFDAGSSHDEDSSFAFTGSFFNEKKATETKSPSCPDFLFVEPEQSEDFQFGFTSQSPQAANKANSRDEFPFSFNF